MLCWWISLYDRDEHSISFYKKATTNFPSWLLPSRRRWWRLSCPFWRDCLSWGVPLGCCTWDWIEPLWRPASFQVILQTLCSVLDLLQSIRTSLLSTSPCFINFRALIRMKQQPKLLPSFLHNLYVRLLRGITCKSQVQNAQPVWDTIALKGIDSPHLFSEVPERPRPRS